MFCGNTKSTQKQPNETQTQRFRQAKERKAQPAGPVIMWRYKNASGGSLLGTTFEERTTDGDVVSDFEGRTENTAVILASF